MKIIFVAPVASKEHPDQMIEPLNIGYIASYLKSKGYDDIELYFAAFTPVERIVKKCSKADVVGISSASAMMTQGIQIADSIKKLNPNVVTVVGGAHISALPEQTLEQCQPIDIAIKGEAEKSFYEVVDAVANKKSFSNIKGITYRENGKIINNPEVDLIENLDELPYPDRELMQQRMFIKKNLKSGKRIAWMMATRGCPFTCTFCTSFVVWTRKYRTRSPENILGEIRELVEKYKVNHIDFADDTLTIKKQWTSDLCKAIKDSGLEITWRCNSQVSTVTKEMLSTMKDAGCEQVWYGVETGSQEILNRMEKSTTIQQARNAFKWSKEIGLKTRANIIVGGSGESHETIEQTEALIEEIEPTAVTLNINTMLPGLKGYKEAIEKGYIEEDKIDWTGVGFRNPHAAIIPTEHLSREDIIGEYYRLSEKYKNYKIYDFHFRYMPEYLTYKLINTKITEYPRLFKRLLYHLQRFDLKRSISNGTIPTQD